MRKILVCQIEQTIFQFVALSYDERHPVWLGDCHAVDELWQEPLAHIHGRLVRHFAVIDEKERQKQGKTTNTSTKEDEYLEKESETAEASTLLRIYICGAACFTETMIISIDNIFRAVSIVSIAFLG